jgi:xanthine dehydrogenase YagR molybdenum-binding subunit
MASTTQPTFSTTDIIGKPLDRVDGRQKVTGAALYTGDHPADQVAHAVVVTSTIASGTILKIDNSVLALPGVLALITPQNALRPAAGGGGGRGGRGPGPALADMNVHYPGQIIAVVVAETITAALFAAKQVKVTYDEQKPILTIDGNAGAMTRSDRGDAPGALAAAPVKVDFVYSTPNEFHNPMEPGTTLAVWNGHDLNVFDSTQNVAGVRATVAGYFGADATSVRVQSQFMGGGFGCKGTVWPHVTLAAMAARVVARPVKLALTREQMFSCMGYRGQTRQRVALGADTTGKLTAVIHENTCQLAIAGGGTAENGAGGSAMLYACDNVQTASAAAAVNAPMPTYARAPGHASGSFAMESAMDELAHALTIDPLQLRLINYSAIDPSINQPFSSKGLRDCYTQGAAAFGWDKRSPKPASVRHPKNPDLLVGMGMATSTYPAGGNSNYSVRIRITSDGRADVATAAHDLGTGTYTILAQVASQYLGIVPGRIKVELADTNLPPGPGAFGSMTAASITPVVAHAAEQCAAALKSLAVADPKSPLFGAGADALVLADGNISLKSDASKSESIAAVVQRGGKPIEITSQGSGANPMPGGSRDSWGAQFAEVVVDPRLGMVRVTRFLGVFEPGRVLNAKTARSQLMGGIVWGISMALHEDAIIDPRGGKMVTDNLADYLVPTNLDIPHIDVQFVEVPDAQVNTMGVKGIGELGITGAAAAVANAVFNATGKRIRDLPIRPEHFLG